MSDINQIKNIVKDELEKGRPSPIRILSCLSSLRILKEGVEFDPKDEWRYLPDIEFFDIVAETFKLNPEFFMKHLYHKVIPYIIRKKLRKDMKKRRGISFIDLVQWYMDKLVEMDKYIFENFCLYDREKILLESGGSIQWGGVSFVDLWFYVTNNRIIFQRWDNVILVPFKREDGSSIRNLKRLTNSIQQKCYGYMIPIQNLSKLTKISNGVSYKVKLNDRAKRIKIKIAKIPNREEHTNKIFEILSKHSKDEVSYPQG